MPILNYFDLIFQLMYDRAKSTQSERDRADARYNRIMSSK